MQLAVIADTHLPRGRRALPEECARRMAAADLVIHAGDVMTAEVLRELEAVGTPVVAVCGNRDDAALQAELPAETVVDAGGAAIAVVHDAGPAKRRLARLRRRFPGADAVVFGHSHIPLHERGEDGFQIFNPGSPTDRRRQPEFTMGIAEAASGVLEFEHVVLR